MSTGTTYDVAALRAHFPALADGTAYFDGPGGSQTPTAVAEAVAGALVAGLSNRGGTTASERRADAVVLAARQAAADLVGGDPAGVVVGRSMTALTFDLARTLAAGWGPGDEVVVTRLDHDANVAPWTSAAAAVGATVRWADFDPATGELDPAAITGLLGPRTRLVAVTGASNLLGTRPDVAAITEAAHDAGALVHVDGVHLTAHHRVDLPAIGADLYSWSPYKVLGPHCGVLHGDPALLETLHPAKLEPSPERVPERFEAGTLPYELLAGLSAAVDFLAGLADVVGAPAAAATDPRPTRLAHSLAAVEAHEARLRDRVEQGATDLGVTVRSRAARRTPTLLLTFEDVPGVEAADAYRFLAGLGVNAPASHFYAVHASRHLGLGDTGGLRVGISPYTDDEDVDRLLDGLGRLVTGPR
ncbi:hypothetical protein ENKNEFLB_00545 [Nocardioides aquaticus]|uniref:Aminotransferase class V domain-containing protein n=1 Tax=Nocardioides aquaticus TaxID=160826 RepID=A0ABX8EDM6_9ACTN|nr:cysteine desulfurase-like protein [Nocardioides aquaticus]QVT78172.1 hypothetical protein ENKNEFLB_00545 [Nocardioides aquaticus]